MTKFVELRVETYSYLIVEGREDKKSKSTKRYVVKTNFSEVIIFCYFKQIQSKIWKWS